MRSSLDRGSGWSLGLAARVVGGLVGMSLLLSGLMSLPGGGDRGSANTDPVSTDPASTDPAKTDPAGVELADPELVATSNAETDLVVYFGATVPETEALHLIRSRELGRVASSYDTTHVRVGLIVPPTEQQLARLRARTDVWRAAIPASVNGAEPRETGDTLSPEREARLEKKRRTGVLCPTIYLDVAVAPHVAEATIRGWLQAIPTTAVPAIRKPANDVRVIPEDAAAAQAVHAFGEHAAVALVAVAGE